MLFVPTPAPSRTRRRLPVPARAAASAMAKEEPKKEKKSKRKAAAAAAAAAENGAPAPAGGGARAAVVASVAAFLESAGLPQTLAALQSEAGLEAGAWGSSQVNLEEPVAKFLESSNSTPAVAVLGGNEQDKENGDITGEVSKEKKSGTEAVELESKVNEPSAEEKPSENIGGEAKEKKQKKKKDKGASSAANAASSEATEIVKNDDQKVDVDGEPKEKKHKKKKDKADPFAADAASGEATETVKDDDQKLDVAGEAKEKKQKKKKDKGDPSPADAGSGEATETVKSDEQKLDVDGEVKEKKQKKHKKDKGDPSAADAAIGEATETVNNDDQKVDGKKKSKKQGKDDDVEARLDKAKLAVINKLESAEKVNGDGNESREEEPKSQNDGAVEKKRKNDGDVTDVPMVTRSFPTSVASTKFMVTSLGGGLVENAKVNVSKLYLRQISGGSGMNQLDVIHHKGLGRTIVHNWGIYDGVGDYASLVANAHGMQAFAGKWNNWFTLEFVVVRFKGSTLQVMGANDDNEGNEWAIVGGTGEFAMARGIIERRVYGYEEKRNTLTQELTIEFFCRMKEHIQVVIPPPTMIPAPTVIPGPTMILGPTKIPTRIKRGPWGGKTGSLKDMEGKSQRLESLTIYHYGAVEGFQFSYTDEDGEIRTTGIWGQNRNLYTTEITFAPTEFVKQIKGAWRGGEGWLSKLEIVTNHGTYGPYGADNGTPFFSHTLPENETVVGFFGEVNTFITRIGVYTISK